MKRIFCGAFICLFLCISSLGAQTTPAPTSAAETTATQPTPSTTPSEAVTEGGSAISPETVSPDTDEEDKPFAPHWTGQVGFTYSNQPSSAGQGQIEKQLCLNGTYNLTESGHYLSMGLTGGQEIVEGSNTNFGEISLEGGLGLGFFNPALELTTQQGAAALNEYGSTLTMNLKPWDEITIGLIGGGGLSSHQGPPPNQSTDKIDEIDEYSYSGELQVSVEPADDLSLSLTAEDEWDTTYQWQNVTHANVHPLNNETDQMPSLTLGIDVTFLKNYEAELDIQAGREYQPAGLFYSPKLAKFLFNANQAEQNFQGISLVFNYNIE